jgi:Domain of unknown function (DUF4328)
MEERMQSRPLPAQDPTGNGAASGWVAAATPYRPLQWPARVVEALLAVYLLVSLAAVAVDWLELNLWPRLLHDPAGLLEAQAIAANSRQPLLAVLQAGAYLLTSVGFLVWFHRAYTNLQALGMEHLPYTPGWAVGAWLVPLLNLVRPKRMMDTIWRGSDPDRPRTADAFWRDGPVHALVHWWWAVFLLQWLVDRVLAALLHQGFRSEEALHAISVRTLVSDSLGLVLGVLCFEVVRRATRRQRARAEVYSQPRTA